MTLSALLPFFKNKKDLKKCCLKELLFSRAVYQVQVSDEALAEAPWVFLRIEERGEIADAFCSCDAEEEGCIHRAFAYLAIQDQKHRFIHERFTHSLWNVLGRIWFERYGSVKPKKSKKGLSMPGFDLEWKKEESRGSLLEIIEAPEVTEENSIKFAGLSEEELERFREGNPASELAYELSFWGDLAKLLFLESSSKVEFAGEGLPTKLFADSEGFRVVSSLEPKDWESLIPVLSSVKNPFKVYQELKDLFQKIDFDAIERSFLLTPKEKPKGFANAQKIGQWLFAPGVGFFPAVSQQEVIASDQIAPFLDRHGEELNSFFQKPICQDKLCEFKVKLYFDEHWNFKSEPYIFRPGDVKEENLFGRWIYVEGIGFLLYRRTQEGALPFSIHPSELPAFIHTHAHWLNQQRGFSVHLGGLDRQLTYNVDERGTLRFSQMEVDPSGGMMREFGSWLYLKDSGFFHKSHTEQQLTLPFTGLLRSDQVAEFIRRNAKELEMIPGFFLAEPLFEEGGLEVVLAKNDSIQILPHYVVTKSLESVKLRFYDEWVYAAGMGFSELPSALRVPEKYREPVQIPKENVKNFLEDELKQIKQWVLHVDPRLVQPLFLKLELEEISPGPLNSWRLKLRFRTDRGTIEIPEILEALKKKKFYLFSSAGLLPLFKDRLLWLRRLRPDAVEKGGTLILTTAELLRLHAYEEIEVHPQATELFHDIVELRKVPDPDFSALTSVLRPYQEKGARWLHSLCHYQLGGLLCDEMGLGKTHQAMAVIAASKKDMPTGRFLIVCPTSVLYHWEDKLKAFLPSLSVQTFHGPFRKKDLKSDFDILLTSYGVLRNEGDWFKENHFEVAIFDEIQAAKNHRSKLYSALSKIRAHLRVGLTGTPVENRLRELKTLFDLVLPGYMPQEADYNKMIVLPIEKGRDMEQKGLLMRMTRPFVYRRLKKDVMNDLPQKTEEIAHCELLPSQERLYREVLLLQRDELMHDLMDLSKAVPYLHIFSLLSRLKQICNHPALYYKKTEEYAKYHSGKWELFKELLNEARDSGQKVVVYSQYLGMLDIIELYLNEMGIGFAKLRGSTRDRREQVELFSNDPACEVFVASLKAAGLGIDLTKASVVIHYDRWWNAARENQATDRVHRFGQSRGVQVFKLVTKNSFEERINQIIERKKFLLEEAVGADEEDVIKTFTREEIFDLLKMHY